MIGVRRGHWAECLTQVPGEDERLIGSFDAASAEEAVGWVGSLFQLASHALESVEASAEVPHASESLWGGAIESLERGRPFRVAVRTAGVSAQWRVQPVAFLPLAGRDDRQLPACAGHFACLVDGPHHFGCAHG